MEILLTLTYVALCYATFKLFRIPVRDHMIISAVKNSDWYGDFLNIFISGNFIMYHPVNRVNRNMMLYYRRKIMVRRFQN